MMSKTYSEKIAELDKQIANLEAEIAFDKKKLEQEKKKTSNVTHGDFGGRDTCYTRGVFSPFALTELLDLYEVAHDDYVCMDHIEDPDACAKMANALANILGNVVLAESAVPFGYFDDETLVDEDEFFDDEEDEFECDGNCENCDLFGMEFEDDYEEDEDDEDDFDYDDGESDAYIRVTLTDSDGNKYTRMSKIS